MDNTNIASAQYINDPTTGMADAITAIIDGIQMSIPLDPANRHYAEILRQVEAGDLVVQEAEGNEPLPADPVE